MAEDPRSDDLGLRAADELGVSEADLPATYRFAIAPQALCCDLCGSRMMQDAEPSEMFCSNGECRRHGSRYLVPIVEVHQYEVPFPQVKGPPLKLTSPPG